MIQIKRKENKIEEEYVLKCESLQCLRCTSGWRFFHFIHFHTQRERDRHTHTDLFRALVRFGNCANVCIRYFCGLICSPLTSIFNWLMRPFVQCLLQMKFAHCEFTAQLNFYSCVSCVFAHTPRTAHRAHAQIDRKRATSAMHCVYTLLITLQNNHLRMPNAMQCKANQFTLFLFKAMRCADFHLKHRKLHVYTKLAIGWLARDV